jgi:tetratricopeptide (TPR) repeat protein
LSKRKKAFQSTTPQPALLRRPRGGWRGLPVAIVLAAVAGFFFWTRRAPSPRPTAPAAAPALPAEERALREAVARLPRDADAHRALARTLLDQRRPFEALWQFRQALDLRPADSDTPVAMARALSEAGLPSLAGPLLHHYLSRAPTDPGACLAMARAALAAARPEDALATLGRAGSTSAKDAQVQLLQGDARGALGDTTGARAAYQRAAALEPVSAASFDRLGRLALSQGQWEAAKSALRAAREREPAEVGHAFRLGVAYWGAGQREEAERLWAEIAAGAPAYASAHLALGRAYRQRQLWGLAVEQLAAAAGADPRLPEAQLELAGAMAAMGRASSALYQRGLYYLQTDRPDLALACYQKMAAVNPASATAPLMGSFCRMQVQDYRAAAVEAERGLRAHPGDPALRQRLIQLYLLTGNSVAAEKLCREWLQESPTAAEPRRLLGHGAFNAMQYDTAVTKYEEASQLDPTNADVILELGKALAARRGVDDLPRAEAAFRRAVGLAPARAEAHQSLGLVLQRQGRMAEARDELLRALDLDPGVTATANLLSALGGSLRQPAEARLFSGIARVLEARERESQALWRAIARQPRDGAAHERLARLLTEAGDLRRASYQWEQVVELQPRQREARERLAVVRRLLALRER